MLVVVVVLLRLIQEGRVLCLWVLLHPMGLILWLLGDFSHSRFGLWIQKQMKVTHLLLTFLEELSNLVVLITRARIRSSLQGE